MAMVMVMVMVVVIVDGDGDGDFCLSCTSSGALHCAMPAKHVADWFSDDR